MLTKIAASGLDAAAADQLGVRPLTRAEAQRELGVAAYEFPAAMLIPYLDAERHSTDFFRVRGLGTVKSAFGEKREPPKYRQRAKSLNRAYLAPTLTRPWSEIRGNPEEPVIITEGELKAAKACAEGFTTIGLGGVDAWSAKGRGFALLPDLDAWEWGNREVRILYDADITEKAEVQSAQDRLARALTERGATVFLAFLPADGPKGMDDFLVERGPEALRAVIEAAVPAPHGLALRGMSERVVYVENPGVIAVRKDGQLISPDNARAHRFANVRHHIRRPDGGLKEVSTFDEWIRWRERLECGRLVYEPGQPEITGRDYNTWRPGGCEPKKGKTGPFKELLDHLFQGADPAHRQWFERWLAYPLQHPGAKLYSAVVVWSHEKGVGKDLLAETIARIYGTNFRKVEEQDLASQFTGWLKQVQFVYGDEITGNDSRAHANHLKRLITSETVTINEKFLPQFSVRNTVNFLFSSNHADAFRIENRDRRYFIHEVTAPRMEDAMGDRIGTWKNSPDGPPALLHYLLNLNLGDFNPHSAPPMTPAKEAMTYDAESDLGQWVMDLVEDPMTTLSAYGPFRSKVAVDCDLFTARQLLAVFTSTRGGARPMTEATMGMKLKEHGLRLCGGRTGVVRVGGRTCRLYAVRNRERWLVADGKECAEHRLKFFPGTEAPGPKKRSDKF
jgi:hypothetical protein